MRINSEQLPKQLAGGLKPLYAVYGDEPLLVLEAADRVRAAAAAAGYSTREVTVADSGFDWARLVAGSHNMSLFGDRRVLDLRIPTAKPGREGAQALADYCAALPADTLTVISLPKLEWQALKSEWFSALDGAGVVVAANQIERSQLPQWIGARLGAQAQSADAASLRFLAEHVEGNLLAAHQELQKLKLLFGEGELSFAQVKDAVLDVARYDAFQLGEAMVTGDAVRAARVLDGLKGEGVAPTLILWVLSEDLRALAKILAGLSSGRQLPQLLRDARVWGPRVKLISQAVKRVRRRELEDATLHAARIDLMIKGLRRGDIWDELLQLVLSLCPATQKVKTA